MMISNEKISAKKVRLVHNDKSEIVSLDEALELAYGQNLDLVQVNENEVPVVKIMDLSKYLYEQKKAQKDNEKKQRQNTPKVKEIRFTTETDENDLNSKFKSAQTFLEAGDHVKLVVKMTGRITSQERIDSFVSKVNELLKSRITLDYTEEHSVQKNKIFYIVKPVVKQ